MRKTTQEIVEIITTAMAGRDEETIASVLGHVLLVAASGGDAEEAISGIGWYADDEQAIDACRSALS